MVRTFRFAALLVALAAGVVLAGATQAQAASCPWLNRGRSPAVRTHELLAAMSLADKIQAVTGQYWAGPGNQPGAPNSGPASFTYQNPGLCIPALIMNDSINGMGDAQSGTTAFPDSIDLTASWDPQLGYRYGQVLADEALVKGINVILGPGVDIARNPLNGRNFEYAGEDPYLAGQAGAAIIRGVQSEHVIATVKHYALNDQEFDRNTDSSDASIRTMEEIDLPAFDAAVKAGVGSVMCSYNRVNSVYACENPYTLGVLDRQFGFTGFVMSDWGATHSTVPSANAGLDMEMPSAKYFGTALQAAVQSGKVKLSTLDAMVYRIIFTMFRLGIFDHVPQASSGPATNATSLAMATKVAESGTTLLKNAGGVLPLTGSGKRIAVIGPGAGPAGAELANQGYGSGHVPELSYQPGVVSPLQAMQARAARAGDTVIYADGGATADAIAAAKAADVAVVFIYDAEIEGSDRPSLNANAGTCSFLAFGAANQCAYSSLDQNALVSAVAAANRHTIVVVQSGDPVAMPWIAQVPGVVENWFPGQVDGNAIAPILFGDVDPSGKLPLTFPVKLSDDPLQTSAQYPGVMRTGDTLGPHSAYSEGLDVGYRWYGARHIEPLFPFGFGLSYTTFRFRGLRVRTARGGVAVARFTVQNTGSRYGADVAQAYVGMPPAAGEPPIQLKGFRKVWLAAGRSVTVTIRLGRVAFAHWAAGHWSVSQGVYRIYVGDSSADLPLRAALRRRAARLPASAY